MLAGKAELDTYTHAHFSDLAARIRKVLDAAMELKVGGGKSSGGRSSSSAATPKGRPSDSRAWRRRRFQMK